MDSEIIQILNNFGTMGLWGAFVYKALDILGVFCCLLLIGHGVKKAWPEIKDKL